jgi:riboflavin kinase/FMN adenylyltransferase
MRIFRSLAEIPQPFGPTVASIGNFDGVHRGHQWILAHLKERARTLGACSVAITFEPHPLRFLRPAEAPRLITPLDEKLLLLEETGIDAVLVLPFTTELSRMSAHDFASAILARTLRVIEVHEGENFRFGHRAQAGTADLVEFGRAMGFAVQAYPALHRHGLRVSSSEVRARIAAGDMPGTRALLGRPFAIHSTPARGRGIGSQLTVPTVNLAPYAELVPANGVYVTWLKIAGDTFESVTNAGVRPTFGEDSYAIESHILNFHPCELTATTQLELTFLERIRAEQRFPSPEALREQILKDVAHAKRYFQLTRKLVHTAE